MNKIISESRNKTILLLLIIGALVYGQTLNFSFLHWDDDAHILSHPSLTWATLVPILTQPYYGLFIPVTYLLWGCINLALSWFQISPHPLPFHALNLLLHLINSIQVYSLIKLVGLEAKSAKRKGPGSKSAAQVGALLFLLHPLQVAAVAWISGGRDLLSAAFGLWATRAYLRSGRKTLPTILYGLGILSKPSLIFLPLGLLVLKPGKVRESLPWLILCSILGGFILFRTRAAQSYSLMPAVEWFQRPLIAIDSLGFYLQKVIFPYSLSVDYGRTPEWVLQHNSFFLSGAYLLAFAGVLGISGISGILRPVLPSPIKKGLGLSFLLILPVLGWLPSAQQSISTVADHYFYLAMVGFSICAAALTDQIKKSRHPKLGLSFIGAWLLTLGLTSFFRCPVWENDNLFFESMVRDNPASVNGQIGLGNLASNQGRDSEATEHFRKAHTLAPDNATAFANFSLSLEREGKDEEILKEIGPILERVAVKNVDLANIKHETSPYLVRTWDVLAASQMRLNQFDLAWKSLCRSLKIDPTYSRTVELWAQLKDLYSFKMGHLMPPCEL